MQWRVRTPLLVFLTVGIVLAVCLPGKSQEGSIVKLYHKSHKQFSPADLARLASRYELVFAVEPDQVATIRARNPKVLIILYAAPGGRWKSEQDYAVVAAKESWFVHDARGNRVRNNNLWLLDMGNPEYRAYELDMLMKKVAAHAYDGLYFDLAHPYWVERRNWTDASGARVVLPEAVVRSWPANMLSFLEAVRARLHPSKKFFWNTLALTVDRAQEWAAWERRALAVTDGGQLDGFCFNRERPYAEGDWRHQVDRIAEIAAMKKIVLVKAPVTEEVGPAALERLKVFCFASYLLAADGRFAYYWPSFELGEPNFDPKLYGAPLGPPRGSYRQVQSVLQRDFAAGRVIVNPTVAPVTVRLDSTFRTHFGAPVPSTVILEPLSALVLLKS